MLLLLPGFIYALLYPFYQGAWPWTPEAAVDVWVMRLQPNNDLTTLRAAQLLLANHGPVALQESSC